MLLLYTHQQQRRQQPEQNGGVVVICLRKLLYEAEPPNWILVQSGLEDHEVSLQQAFAAFAAPGPTAAAAAAPAAAADVSNDAQRAAAGGGVAAAERQNNRRKEGESLLAGALSIALCCRQTLNPKRSSLRSPKLPPLRLLLPKRRV